MGESGSVVRLECTEALVTAELRPLAQRKVFWFVKVPPGAVAPEYAWSLDVAGLARGAQLPPVTDQLHQALMALYHAEAEQQRLAEPNDTNSTQPLAVGYRLLTPDELAKRPWRGTICLRLTDDGKLVRASDNELP